MSDDPVRTRVRTDEGWIDFQDYFVRRRCEPVVHELAFHGADDGARASGFPGGADRSGGCRRWSICPSNPFISIEPILAVPGVRAALADCAAPVVAVSPMIGGRAIKGPTAKMMAELGMTPSAGAVARRYGDLLDGYVVDYADAGSGGGIVPGSRSAQTMMTTLDDREALARTVLGAAACCGDDDRVSPDHGRIEPVATGDGTSYGADIWAAVPVKEFAGAKQRLAPLLTPAAAQALAAAMLEDVLAALAGAPLAGIMVNTVDPVASGTGAAVWRAGGDGRCARWAHRRGHRDGADPCRGRPRRHADGARRHSARHGRGDRADDRGASPGAVGHHRAGA